MVAAVDRYQSSPSSTGAAITSAKGRFPTIPSSSSVVGACQTPTVSVPPWAAVPPGCAVGDFAGGDDVQPASTTARTVTSGSARRHDRPGRGTWVGIPPHTRACIVPRPYSGTGVVDGLMGIFAARGGIWRHAMRIGRGRLSAQARPKAAISQSPARRHGGRGPAAAGRLRGARGVRAGHGREEHRQRDRDGDPRSTSRRSSTRRWTAVPLPSTGP